MTHYSRSHRWLALLVGCLGCGEKVASLRGGTYVVNTFFVGETDCDVAKRSDTADTAPYGWVFENDEMLEPGEEVIVVHNPSLFTISPRHWDPDSNGGVTFECHQRSGSSQVTCDPYLKDARAGDSGEPPYWTLTGTITDPGSFVATYTHYPIPPADCYDMQTFQADWDEASNN